MGSIILYFLLCFHSSIFIILSTRRKKPALTRLTPNLAQSLTFPGLEAPTSTSTPIAPLNNDIF